MNTCGEDAMKENVLNMTRALVLKAILDAAGVGHVTREDQAEATVWLLGEDAVFFCDLLGYDHQVLIVWVKAGCPAAALLLADRRMKICV
jgi:hypothetical protein